MPLDLGELARLQESPSEMEFNSEASLILSKLINRTFSENDPFQVRGIQIFETCSAPLMLYYLQKGCKTAFIAGKILDQVQSDKITLSSVETDLELAVFMEAKQRGLSVQVENGNCLKRVIRKLMTPAWLAREVMLTLKAFLRKKEPGASDFLFLCNVNRQHETLIPLIKELSDTGSEKLTILSKTASPMEHAKHSYYLSWENIRSVGYLFRLIPQAIRMRLCWRKLVTSLFNTRPYLTTVLDKWHDQSGLQALRALLLAEQAIQKIKPRVTIATDPADFEAKSFTLIGKKSGIPSLCLQYGLACHLDSEWRYFAQDVVGVFDEASARVVMKLGLPSDRVRVTGNPRFDRICEDRSERARVRSLLKIPEGVPLVTYMSVPPALPGTGQIESNMPLAAYRQILKAVYALPAFYQSCVVAIKPHPEEKCDFHHSLAKESPAPDKIHLIEGLNAFQTLNASDVVITPYSTSGLEAIYLDKPLVLVQMSHTEDLVDFANSGAAMLVQDLNKMAPLVRDLIENSDTADRYRQARATYMKVSRGEQSSAARCAALLRQLAGWQQQIH